jgi:acetylornithine/N-succinyldiaminopimelate aminotransferase
MDIVNIADQVITQTYARYPLALIRGQGCTLFDDQGRAYTDFIAGIAVCNLGHAHPKLIASLVDQAERLWHVSNLYYTQPPGRTGRLADLPQLCRPSILRQQRRRGQ